MNTPIFGTFEQRVPVLYALVRFRPFAETGEFANVGVLVCCPHLNFIDFRMQNPNVKRVIDFFDRFDASRYKAAVKSFERAMADIKQLGESLHSKEKTELFKAFIHPREALMTFSEYSVVMSLNPQGELDRIFEHYIRQNFSKDLQAEHKQEVEIRSIVQRLGKRFVKQRITMHGVSAEFPFVQTRNDTIDKVIKPLYLGQDTANKIYAHGDAWVSKVRRLREALPEQTLFAIQGDMTASPVRDIVDELKSHRIIIEPYRNTQKIETFVAV